MPKAALLPLPFPSPQAVAAISRGLKGSSGHGLLSPCAVTLVQDSGVCDAGSAPGIPLKEPELLWKCETPLFEITGKLPAEGNERTPGFSLSRTMCLFNDSVRKGRVSKREGGSVSSSPPTLVVTAGESTAELKKMLNL